MRPSGWAHGVWRRAVAAADMRERRKRARSRIVPAHMKERMICELPVTLALIVWENVRPSSCR